jgi:hypothetical protein
MKRSGEFIGPKFAVTDRGALIVIDNGFADPEESPAQPMNL